jgi:hypothetical protein
VQVRPPAALTICAPIVAGTLPAHVNRAGIEFAWDIRSVQADHQSVYISRPAAVDPLA